MTNATKRALLVDLIDDFKASTGGNFLDWVYDVLFELDEDEIPSDELIEGSGEKQIDVLRIEDNPDEKTATISVLQTKETGGFAENIVILIANGISTIFESSKTDLKKLKNETLAAKSLEIRETVKAYGTGQIDLHVYYATKGNSSDINSDTKGEIRQAKKKLEAIGFKSTKFELLGATELYDMAWSKQSADRQIDADISVLYDVNRPSIIEFETADYKAVVCTVSGKEIARLAAITPTDAIFDMNLRGHLGKGGRVNSNIMEACTDPAKAKTFWFKNNGITMVCSHFDMVKDPDEAIVKVKNVQIVNGCQTSVTLREAEKDSKLDDSVFLLAKIYELSDANLVNGIVLATNNQNSILSRDLFANDEIQTLIQEMLQSKLNLFYERKRGEARSKKVPRSDTIDSEKAGQSYLAIVKKSPTISRAQKYRIYEPTLYDEIFKKSKPLHLALCYCLYEFCKKNGATRAKKLHKGQEEHSLLTYGVFHLARAFSYYFFKSDALPSDDKSIIEAVTSLRAGSIGATSAFSRAVKLCLRVLKSSSADSANNYFKSQASQEEITAEITRVATKKRRLRRQRENRGINRKSKLRL